VTAFAAKPRTLIVAFPHFRNEDENASMNTWSLCVVSRLETDSDDEPRRFGIEGKGPMM
jgi:hypothetical protein